MKITKNQLKSVIKKQLKQIIKEIWDETEFDYYDDEKVYSEDGNRSYRESEEGGFDLYQIDQLVGNVQSQEEAELFNQYRFNPAPPPADLYTF